MAVLCGNFRYRQLALYMMTKGAGYAINLPFYVIGRNEAAKDFLQ